MAFLELEWNRPDRGDHYLMELTRVLVGIPARVWGEAPPDLGPKDLRLKFLTGPPMPPADEATSDEPWDETTKGPRPPRRLTKADLAKIDLAEKEHRLRRPPRVPESRQPPPVTYFGTPAPRS